jgi:hypothetical protein
MAKPRKKAAKTAAAPRKRRKRRNAEEIIADLEAEIRRVQDRQKQRELKTSPSMKASISALKAIDKALEAAAEDSNAVLRHTLANSRRVLGAYLEKQGMRLPKANLPRGRKPGGITDD